MATVPAILDDEHFAEAKKLVERYFGLAEGSRRHEGAWFETIGGRGDDPATENVVTAGDLIALATLSVEVKGAAAIALLEPDFGRRVTDLLTNVPVGLSLADPSAEGVDREDSDASELWRLVRTVPGFGPTRTSKLLARKRPRLIPIYDSVVAEQLGLSSSIGHWALMRELVTQDDGALYRRAERIRDEVGLGPTLSPLRVIDIVLWRHGKDMGLKAKDDA